MKITIGTIEVEITAKDTRGYYSDNEATSAVLNTIAHHLFAGSDHYNGRNLVYQADEAYRIAEQMCNKAVELDRAS